MKQSTKQRLQSGFLILEVIRNRRYHEESPGLGWAIERGIVDREIRELEEDLRLHPPLCPEDQKRPR